MSGLALSVMTALLAAAPEEVAAGARGPAIRITLARGSDREQAARAQLQRLLETYDLAKYARAPEVVFEQGAVNHAFPVLTLNVWHADAPDDLLASYVHEQIHWHLRERDRDQRQAVAELRRLYPKAPVGLPDGAVTAYSTYGHLVTCLLEVDALRRLLGPERAAGVLGRKRHYLWIYRTVIEDEGRIAAVVRRYGLGIERQ